MPKLEVKTRNFRSLTVTLVAAFLGLGITVILIAASLGIYFNFQTQRKIISGQQQLIAQDAANTVKGFVQEKLSILDKAVALGGLATASQEEQKLLLGKLLGKESSFRQLVLSNAQEQELLRVSRLSKLLSVQLMKYNKSELFSQVKQGNIYIGSVYVDEVTSEPMMVMAVPVTDVFGDFKGVLMAEVNLKFMWDLVDKIKVGDKGIAYVVDMEGNLIAFGDISRILRRENLVHLDEVNEFVRGNEVVHESETEISKGIQDNYVVTTHAHLGTPDWAVVVELPIVEAYEMVIHGVGVSVGAIILSTILAIVAGIYLSKRITKPIISLRDAAIKIGEGSLDTKIEIKTKDEIGELAIAFNHMTGDLRKSKDELEKYSKTLEKKVEERTRELSQKNEELERFNKLAVGRELKMVELKKKIKEFEEKLQKK